MVDFKKMLREHQLQTIVTALCEVSGRCSVCYAAQNGASCVKCMKYYSECNCKPLTPEQIVNWEEME